METLELRDADDARRFLLHGLWLQRVLAPQAESTGPMLEWALELAAQGDPLPPMGFVGDLGHLVQADLEHRPTHRDLRTVPGFAPGLVRAYEDYVLGRLYADPGFDRGAAAVGRLRGRDRTRGIACLINQIRQRTGFGGVVLGPAAIKDLMQQTASDLLSRAWDEIGSGGLHRLLAGLYEQIITAVRNAGSVLGPEDLFELEHGLALAEFSQRLALRQVLQAAAVLESDLQPDIRRRPQRQRNVPTRMLDEDTYPVGGFSSIATRGSIESLLHSQLAYMEPQGGERPDLFDIKFLRDELLYYARDENEFLRRRQTFLFVLFPVLSRSRVKDAGLPWQRTVLVLAMLVVCIRKLIDLLSADALRFEFVWIESPDGTRLASERNLLELLFRDEIASGMVVHTELGQPQLAAHCALRARRSLCHCLTLSTGEPHLQAHGAQISHLRVSGARPVLRPEHDDPETPADAPESDLDAWQAATEALLTRWL